MKNTLLQPLPLFDTAANIEDVIDYGYLQASYCLDDLFQAKQFLTLYRGSQGTFNSYRREIERLIHWAALITNKKLSELNRHDIENFITFCSKPNKNWIGVSKPARFLSIEGERKPNPNWHPFVVTVSKAKHQEGFSPNVEDFQLASSSIREIFAILGSFYSFLIQEDYVLSNPIALVKQKSKFIRKSQAGHKIRRLSELQWSYVISNITSLAEETPSMYQRTLFIMSALYSMYLRVSELAESDRWQPKMNDFHRDSQERWWFTTVGKGNKERQIAVSDSMLLALKKWRIYLGLSALPSPADNSPLLPKKRGGGGIRSVNLIRKIVQNCFDKASDKLLIDGFEDEAEALKEVTVHWLRHTGISDDVKIRPREHVRDDAGHSSSAITDHYIDIELHERHQSARKKIITD